MDTQLSTVTKLKRSYHSYCTDSFMFENKTEGSDEKTVCDMVGMSKRKSTAQIPKIRHFSAHPERNSKLLHNRNDLFALYMKSRKK